MTLGMYLDPAPTHKRISGAAPQKVKAGFVIVGDMMVDGKPELHVLAPWVEGAFSTDGSKAYTLAKGTVDPGEPEWTGAKREVWEETGIDIDRIDNPLNPTRSHLTATEKNAKPLYEGVEIESIIRRPVFNGVIPSSRGVPVQHILYVVKVKGIENLAPYSKHFEHNQHVSEDGQYASHFVSHRAADIATERHMPDFETLLACLKTGKWHANDGKELELFTPFEPSFGWDAVTNRETLAQLFHTLDVPEKNKLKDHLNAMRYQLENEGILNDSEGMKIGNEHLPLHYYQEGADILPYAEWLTRMLECGRENTLYRDVQFLRPAESRNLQQNRGDQGAMVEMAFEVGRLLDAAQDLHELRPPMVGLSSPSVAYGSALRHHPHMKQEVQDMVMNVSRQQGTVARSA